jgi:hypothetical protein
MSEEPEGGNGEEGSLPAVVEGAIDAVWYLVTGIPAPIRNNAVKAFARLCTTALEYPITVIRGKIAETQAVSQARVKLIRTSGNQIAALDQPFGRCTSSDSTQSRSPRGR